MTSPRAIVVGAGIAGLTAALELQKRGFKLEIHEKSDGSGVGGKLGFHRCDQCGSTHEHTNHIFTNWYHNFWRLAGELGLDAGKYFEPRETVNYLRSKADLPSVKTLADRISRITNEGSIWHAWDNLLGGPESPADMFLYGYSLLDLASEPYQHKSILDNVSVNGFMRSRWYATPEAATLHQRFLNVAFANPSFQTSAESYKNFIRFGAWDPEPQYYMMKQGIRAEFIRRIRDILETGDPARNRPPAILRTGSTITRIKLGTAQGAKSGNRRFVDKIGVITGNNPKEELIDVGEGTFLILAVTLDALHQLVDEDTYEATPNLSNVHSLRSRTLASLELDYRDTIPGIPREHTALVNSPHQLSFFDHSQVSWPEGRDVATKELGFAGTGLTVSVSSFDALDAWDPDAVLLNPRWEHARKARESRKAASDGRATWDHVKRMLFEELEGYLPGLPEPGQTGRMCLVRNTGARLFLNDVHDWSWRPATECEGIANLMLAGEYVQNPIDAVTVESAVVTGLQAAEAVRKQAEQGEEIDIYVPRSYAPEVMKGAALTLAPYAAAAKAWASRNPLVDPTGLVSSGVEAWWRGARSFLKAMRQGW